MRHFFGFILFIALCCTTPVLARATVPTPFMADYRANYMGLQGAARMSLRAEDGSNTEEPAQPRWTLQLDINGAGARMLQSTTFDVVDEQWRPLSSVDSQQGESGLGALLVKNRSTRSVWDWERQQASWSGDLAPERHTPVPLQPGDLDAMLLNLVLVEDVGARKPLTYRLVDDGRAREQRFQRVGTEDIHIGEDSHRALKVMRTDGNRAITVWVVEGLPVPARILQQRNGKDQIDLRLERIQPLPE